MDADPGNTTTPVVGGDRVYFTHLGVVRCLDARTGAEEWNFSPESASVITSPVPWENLIIVGATDACLYALDAADGDKVWERTCAGSISPDPLILGDLLMVGAEKMVYAIEPSSGQATWVCSLTSTARAGPVTDGSMLYFLCQDSSVQCVDANSGRYRWSCPFASGPQTFKPIAAQRRAIVASGNRVYGIARSSAIAWTREMPAGVRGTPTLADDTLFVPCVDGQIYTLRPRSGALRHDVALKLEQPVTASPLVTDTVVVAGTATGLLYLLDRASGKVEWVYRCLTPEQPPDEAAEFGIYAPIVGADGALYCLTGTGDFYRFSASAPDVSGPDFAGFKPDPGVALPSAQSLDLTVAVTDAGTGVDASSLEVTIDGAPVKVSFDVVSGLASMRLLTVADGPHIVKITARDYRGNVNSAAWSFLTDASISAAPEEGPEGAMGRTGAVIGRPAGL